MFDVASEAGVEKHDEDFGQTFGYWGVADGPFIMLPFIGPSTGRDVIGRAVDLYTSPLTYVEPTRTRNQLWGTRVVDHRADLLDASAILETIALDPYEFVRDAHLQRRRSLIYDGVVPLEKEFSDQQPKSDRHPEPAYESSADPTGEGPMLATAACEP